jgi:hypothetical protein
VKRLLRFAAAPGAALVMIAVALAAPSVTPPAVSKPAATRPAAPKKPTTKQVQHAREGAQSDAFFTNLNLAHHDRRRTEGPQGTQR